jgi:1-acyl-sn-glycerol-3-phosphate acyltransferase
MRLARLLFFALIVRPLLALLLGIAVKNGERLPKNGPALVAANHNSHFDTLVLMSLFPLARLARLKAVAAADHFGRGGALAWIAAHLVGILPISRTGPKPGPRTEDPLAPVHEALARGEIVFLFPEGTRGEPERLQKFKVGIAHLKERHPLVPVVPVFLAGLGKTLPKGDWLPVPHLCEVFVGEALDWTGDRASYVAALEARIAALGAEASLPPWDDSPTGAARPG